MFYRIGMTDVRVTRCMLRWPATNEGQNVQSITVPLEDSIEIPGELVLDDRSLVHEFLSYCPEAIGGIVGSKQTVTCL